LEANRFHYAHDGTARFATQAKAWQRADFIPAGMYYALMRVPGPGRRRPATPARA
jgi:hypothetical protein